MRNLIITAIVLWAVGCGLTFDGLKQLEKDCKPKLDELEAFPAGNFSLVTFCKCTVKDHGTVTDCKVKAQAP